MSTEQYDYTTTDDDAQHWSAEFGANGSWYWSAEQGKHLLIADGHTDTRDVGDAMAHGRETAEEQVAAADFWAMAAEVAAVNAGTHLALAELEFGEDDSSHNLAVLEEAAAVHAEALAVLDEVQDIREEVRAETGAGDVPEVVTDPMAVGDIYDYLYSAGHAESLSDEEAAEYCADVAEDAEQLAAAGYDVERLRADDAAIEAAAFTSAGLDEQGAIATEDEFLALAEMERHAGDMPMPAPSYEAVRAEYDQLFDPEHYASIEGDGGREDSYCDQLWDTAVQNAQLAEAANANLDGGAAFDAAVNDQLAKHGREPAGPGATDEALARLLDDLDQARCALDADDTPEEDRHGWAEHVEHLEEQVALAQGADHDAVFPATPKTVDGADAEAWGVPDGTPVAELPVTYEEWLAEGREPCGGGAGDGEPHEWSFGDPDDGGEPSPEFVTGEDPEPDSEQGYPVPWDAYRSGPPVDGSGKADEPTAAELAVAAAHEAVESAGEQDSSPAPVAAPVHAAADVDVDE